MPPFSLSSSTVWFFSPPLFHDRFPELLACWFFFSFLLSPELFLFYPPFCWVTFPSGWDPLSGTFMPSLWDPSRSSVLLWTSPAHEGPRQRLTVFEVTFEPGPFSADFSSRPALWLIGLPPPFPRPANPDFSGFPRRVSAYASSSVVLAFFLSSWDFGCFHLFLSVLLTLYFPPMLCNNLINLRYAFLCFFFFFHVDSKVFFFQSFTRLPFMHWLLMNLTFVFKSFFLPLSLMRIFVWEATPWMVFCF